MVAQPVLADGSAGYTGSKWLMSQVPFTLTGPTRTEFAVGVGEGYSR